MMGIFDWLTGGDEQKAEGSSSKAEPSRRRGPDLRPYSVEDADPAWAKEFTAAQLLPAGVSGQPIWKEWDEEAAIDQGLKSATFVYACNYRLAKAVAAANWKAVQVVNGEDQPAPGAPIEELINNPNEFQTRQTFFEAIVMHLGLGGNALLSKVYAGGVPAELWAIDTRYTSPVPSATDFIARYEYRNGDNQKDFDPEDVIHFLYTDPEQPFWGLSPLQAAAKAVDTDNEAANWQKVSLQNRAVTDGVFSFDHPLTKKQWDEAREQIRDQHQGSSNARQPWVLGSGARWNQMSLSPAEMDFIESRRLTREEICAVYNVPPPLVGIYDNATLANIQTARLIFWEDTVIPLLEDLQASLNLALARHFPGYEIRYDVSHISVLLELMLKKMEVADSLWSKGVPMKVVNETLGLGLPRFAGDDLGYIGGGMMPAGMFDPLGNQPPFGEELPPPPPPDDGDEDG